MQVVMCRGPRSPLDGLFHSNATQTHQVPEKGEDETLSGQAQVEGNTEKCP